jgi:hypothetical protein
MPSEQVVVETQILQVKATQGAFTLPCGYLDEDGRLHKDLELREIRGYEEDMLSAPKVPGFKKMNTLLAACTTRLGTFTDHGKIATIVPELLVGDRVYLMFAIRRVTLGDEFPFEDTCPNCQVKKLLVVDLSTLDIRQMPTPEKRLYEDKLPGGSMVRWHCMNGRDEEKLARLGSGVGLDQLSLGMLVRIESVDDAPPTLVTLKNLSMKDRNYLRERFDDAEGGVDTALDMECENCGETFKKEVDVSQGGFFFPSATRKNSRRRSST